MNSGATSERVYDALKRKLQTGDLPPGHRLEPGPIAEDLVSSVTPVRDALHRLMGERLVEARSGTGFHLVTLHEPDLRDLYAWNAQVALDAIRWWPADGPRDVPPAQADPVVATRALFRLFGERSGNTEIIAAIDSASDRLETVRRAEQLAIGAEENELPALRAALGGENASEIGRLVRAYHRRRLIAVPAILRALYRPQ